MGCGFWPVGDAAGHAASPGSAGVWVVVFYDSWPRSVPLGLAAVDGSTAGPDNDFLDQDEDQQLQRSLKQQEAKDQLGRSWVAGLGRLVMRPVQLLLGFGWSFSTTRSRGLFLWGLPLLTIAGVLGVVIYQASYGDMQRIALRYQNAVADAIAEGNDQQVDLFRRKLEQLGVRTDAGEYRTAAAMADQGDLIGAYAKMQAIAGAEKPGFSAAHFWQAQHLIAGDLAIDPEQALPLALQHLQQVTARTGKTTPVDFFEGVVYAKMGQTQAAINSLEQAASEVPAAVALLMEIRTAIGETKRAKDDALVVERQLQQKKSEGKTLSETELRWQASAAKLLGDPEAAALAVQQWYQANPESPEAILNQATVQLGRVDRWLDQIAASNNASNNASNQPGESKLPLDWILQAAKLMPDNRYSLVAGTLNRIWRMRKSSPAVEVFFAKLVPNDSLGQESVTPESLLPGKAIEVFGTAAALDADWVVADRLLGLAAIVDPQWSPAWNNRAYVISEGFPQRWAEAVGYADRAIQLQPGNAEFHETRGMLNLKLQRWELAIVDLEVAVNGLVGQSKQIHQALSVAYRNLGNDRMAEVHRLAGQ